MAASSDPHDPYLGRLIRGYQLTTLLHKGELTATYLAHTEECWLEAELNITIFSLPKYFSVQDQKDFKTRFVRTLRPLLKLRHPALFPLYGFGEEKGMLYLLQPQAVEYTTLAQQIQQQQPWSATDAFALLAPICSALDYLHTKGIAHQFVSPPAIWIQQNGNIQLAELCQQQLVTLNGLAEAENGVPAHLQDLYGATLGSPAYLAPEVMRGGQANARSDIYSLGMILFQLLSGKLPFTGRDYLAEMDNYLHRPLPSLHEIAPDVPFSLELIVNRALQRQARERFATAGEFINALSHVLDERLQRPLTTGISSVIQQMRAPAATQAISLDDPARSRPALKSRGTTPAARKQITTSQQHLPHRQLPQQAGASRTLDEQKALRKAQPATSTSSTHNTRPAASSTHNTQPAASSTANTRSAASSTHNARQGSQPINTRPPVRREPETERLSTPPAEIMVPQAEVAQRNAQQTRATHRTIPARPNPTATTTQEFLTRPPVRQRSVQAADYFTQERSVQNSLTQHTQQQPAQEDFLLDLPVQADFEIEDPMQDEFERAAATQDEFELAFPVQQSLEPEDPTQEDLELDTPAPEEFELDATTQDDFELDMPAQPSLEQDITGRSRVAQESLAQDTATHEKQKRIEQAQQQHAADTISRKPALEQSSHADMERMADHLKRMRERLQQKPVARGSEPTRKTRPT